MYKESHGPPWWTSIWQSRAWELVDAEHHCQVLAFRPTTALTPYGKGAKLASRSSALVGVTARFEMAQALFQNQIPAWYFAAVEGDTGKIQHKTTITTTTHTCAHIHTLPPRSACKCLHSTHVPLISLKNKNKKPTAVSSWVYTLNLRKSLTTDMRRPIFMYFIQEASLTKPFCEILRSNGCKEPRPITDCRCSTASEPPGGTIWVHVPSCQTGGTGRQ